MRDMARVVRREDVLWVFEVWEEVLVYGSRDERYKKRLEKSEEGAYPYLYTSLTPTLERLIH